MKRIGCWIKTGVKGLRVVEEGLQFFFSPIAEKIKGYKELKEVVRKDVPTVSEKRIERSAEYVTNVSNGKRRYCVRSIALRHPRQLQRKTQHQVKTSL